MRWTVHESKEQRMTRRWELRNPPDADGQGDVMIEEVIGDSIVSLPQNENKNFHEESYVVDEKPPDKWHSFVAGWRWVERLTSENNSLVFHLIFNVWTQLTGN